MQTRTLQCRAVSGSMGSSETILYGGLRQSFTFMPFLFSGDYAA